MPNGGNSWGGFGGGQRRNPWEGQDVGQINQALGKTGSNYQVPYSGNPTTFQMNNDDRRALAQQNGMAQRADAADKGGGAGGGMGGMLGGMMGGMGGGGGLMGGGGGGETYHSPPPGETQAQMLERQRWQRNQAEKQRVQNVAAIAAKVFGF